VSLQPNVYVYPMRNQYQKLQNLKKITIRLRQLYRLVKRERVENAERIGK